MKLVDCKSLLPSRVTFLFLANEVVAIRSTRFFARSFGRRAWRFPYVNEKELPGVLQDAARVAGLGHELVHVGLPLDAMTLVQFSLPLGAKEDLPSAIRYALMRHVPFSLDTVRWQYSSKNLGDALAITVTLISESRLSGLEELFFKAGIGVASVFPVSTALLGHIAEGGVAAVLHGDGQDVLLWDGGRVCWQGQGANAGVPLLAQAAGMRENFGIQSRAAAVFGDCKGEISQEVEVQHVQPEQLCLDFSKQFSIDVVSPETMRSVRRLRYAVMVPALALVVTLLLWPFTDLVIWHKRLNQLETRIHAVRDEAGDLAEARQRNSELRSRLERWSEQFAKNIPVTSVLREITRLMPRGAWLESLQIQDHRVVLNGNAPSATVLLEQLENSSFFEDLRFDAPVTKHGQLEKFRIVANISRSES